jgi:DNA-binding transcriptional MocR family regulator
MTHGVSGCSPWIKQNDIKFLCPSPGYDRHFSITQYFGIKMIPIKMNSDGPNMDEIQNWVENDDTVKGIWCVPKYSNPQGITYSDNVVAGFAKLRPAARDFRVFWDNAYAVHDLTNNEEKLLNIFKECGKYNSSDLPIMFCSTSKITFAGSGVSAIAGAGENLKNLKKRFSFKTIGYDKINQLRHSRFFKNINTLKDHMKRHAEILNPKFNLVIDKFKGNFINNPIISWAEPKGGYFISVETLSGCAKETVRYCKKAGLKLTNAGATYPYGIDPNDSNIRIAPSYPNLEELDKAMDIFCLCAKLAAIEKLIK